ncbi:MAG: IS1595 family transposase [Sporocytophaga sp.]|nr:IS1595 family transposase [Sporocytophaga sp.]
MNECKGCKNTTYSRGKQPYSRRCTKCQYDESATSGTFFHKIKFSISLAFEMLYEIVTSKKGANSVWLAERFQLQQKTTWLFRQKVQEAMKSSLEHPLEDEVHVDEFEIGTPQKGQQGRSASEEKIRVVIAIEHRNGTAGRGYAQVITDYSYGSLKPIFEQHIARDAKIETDGWSGYKPLKTEYPNLKQKLSEKGENFKMLHIQIRNFKNWIRGVHSYCNKEYMNKYLQEYFYRFNRRNFRKNILENILKRMVAGAPITYSQIKNQAI